MEFKAVYADEALAHHGIKGQKWGVRRYQNPDGTLTDEGQRRYARLQAKSAKYDTLSSKYSAKEARAAYKGDRIRARPVQTDVSIARANRQDRIRSKARMKSLKYGSLSKKYEDKGKDFIAKSKLAQVKYKEAELQKKKLTENAVDDYIEVLSGNMTKDQYNQKYYGTGFRIR